MKRGKLVVIEGSDGSGKGTQAHALLQYFTSNNINFQFFDFPRYETFFGEFVGCYLRGELGSPASLHPKLKSLPYALDRMQAASQIDSALREGKIVICNRYTISSMAHQATNFSSSFDKDEFWTWLEELEYDQFRIPREDLVIFLDVPPTISQNLLLQKEVRSYTKGKVLDVHEADHRYLQKVHQIYLELAKLKSHWKVINCVDEQNRLRSIDSIQNEILQLLKYSHILPSKLESNQLAIL